ncbi:hypothetical protein YK48G_02950 [Lentilactobacillus fungorum]|uniref:Uncharacterized protein n=1 Tax=Lentilactobacillus fungorum TaxID=2201250 RepID=A0ABQ3VWH6_9LACO|nr:hypothetical protein YK48G_02950 [Lentilactobacillus fungorum]
MVKPFLKSAVEIAILVPPNKNSKQNQALKKQTFFEHIIQALTIMFKVLIKFPPGGAILNVK